MLEKKRKKGKKSKQSQSEQDGVECAGDLHDDVVSECDHKKERVDENTCQGCFKCFDDNSISEQEKWLGCDTCWHWWHYSCSGFGNMLDTRSPSLSVPLDIVFFNSPSLDPYNHTCAQHQSYHYPHFCSYSTICTLSESKIQAQTICKASLDLWFHIQLTKAC